MQKEDWKILRRRNKQWSLFNLKNDIGETRDLADTLPAQAGELIRLWETGNSGMIDPVWVPGRKK
ncbi:MAG: hypothetical protein GY899_02430 [Verrucomicrobiaceae bacterium]|nr:hypothetical protein [Verrucomicrobiaceae bacterium]